MNILRKIKSKIYERYLTHYGRNIRKLSYVVNLKNGSKKKIYYFFIKNNKLFPLCRARYLLFIPEVYLALNPDVRRSGIDPIFHFLKKGIPERRKFSLGYYFDEEWYLSKYPNLKNNREIMSGLVTPEAHYVFQGWRLGYDPSIFFDTSFYLKKNKDVFERDICPLLHYIEVGRSQNREPYNSHDISEPSTLTELPEPFEHGMFSKECKQVFLDDLEDNAVLIMLSEHLGDIIANEPISRYLKFKFNNIPLYWVIEEKFVDVVRYNPCLNGYIIVNSLKDCISIIRRLKNTQKIVNLFFNGRPDNFRKPSCFWYSRRNSIGFGNYYANDCLLSSMSQSAGLTRLLLSPRFWEGPTYLKLTKQEVLEKTGIIKLLVNADLDVNKCRIILLHTKANDHRRDWSADKFVSLIKEILRRYSDVVIVELGMSPTISLKHNRFMTLEKITDLQLIFQVIKISQLMIGIDSSFMQMANASEIQAVSIMGFLDPFSHHCPYSGRFWYGRDISYIRAGERENASFVRVNDVLDAVITRLSFQD